MSTPFSVQAVLQLPPDVGLPPDPVSLLASSQFDSLADYILQLSGSGTHAVGLGTSGSPGLKALLIKVDSGVGAASITTRFNGAVTGGIELSPGGGMLVVSPNPQAGITAVDVLYTASATVRIWALG
jgi:hypothetical protein